MLHEFAQRVRLYTWWDRRLRRQTRFFGAAAAINVALVEWSLWQRSPRWVGSEAIELLSTAGRYLERLNVEMAGGIERGTVRNTDLDSSLIALEQSALEDVLRREARQAPRKHGQAVQQINLVLHYIERWSWPCAFWSGTRLYRNVLRCARSDLGRRPDFASLADRIGIGRTLVLLLTQVDESGSRRHRQPRRQESPPAENWFQSQSADGFRQPASPR